MPTMFSPILCSECNSADFVKNSEGILTCSRCGLEISDELQLVNSEIYGANGLLRYHEIFFPGNITRIGTTQEFNNAPIAIKRALKYDKTSNRSIKIKGFNEILRLLGNLDMLDSEDFTRRCFQEFLRAHKAAEKGTQCRNIRLLALLGIYRAAQFAGIYINPTELLNNQGFDNNVKKRFLNVVQRMCKKLIQVDSGDLLLHSINAIETRCQIPPAIIKIINILIKNEKDYFLHTKPSVSAGAIVATAILLKNMHSEFPTSKIAKSIGVSTSAVLRCIKGTCIRKNQPLLQTPIKSKLQLREIFKSVLIIDN